MFYSTGYVCNTYELDSPEMDPEPELENPLSDILYPHGSPDPTPEALRSR